MSASLSDIARLPLFRTLSPATVEALTLAQAAYALLQANPDGVDADRRRKAFAFATKRVGSKATRWTR